MWKPQLLQRELYSEILDTKFAVTVTARTLDLIDAAYGFDFYILKASRGLCGRRAGSPGVSSGVQGPQRALLPPSPPSGLPLLSGGWRALPAALPHAWSPARLQRRICAPSSGWT